MALVDGETSPAKPPSASSLPIGEPIVAILDGLPLENHRLLQGRLVVDDPTNGRANTKPNIASMVRQWHRLLFMENSMLRGQRFPGRYMFGQSCGLTCKRGPARKKKFQKMSSQLIWSIEPSNGFLTVMGVKRHRHQP